MTRNFNINLSLSDWCAIVYTLEGIGGIIVLPGTDHDLADLFTIEDVLAGGVVDVCVSI